MNIGTLVARIAMDTSDLDRAAEHAEGKFKGVGDVMEDLGHAAKGLAASLAAAFAVHEVVHSVEQFEASLTAARAEMEATVEQAEKMKEMSIAARVPQDAADAFAAMAHEGVAASDAMVMLNTVLDLQKAHSLDVASATRDLLSSMHAYKLESKDAAHVSDLISEGMHLGGQSAADFASALAAAAPIASAFGYSIDQTAAYLALLGQRGKVGGEAGNALAMSMRLVSTAAKKAGVDTHDLGTLLQVLEAHGATASDVMQLFGRKTGMAAGLLVGMADQLEQTTGTFKTAAGVTKEMANIVRDDLGEAWNALKGALSSIVLDSFTKGKSGAEGWRDAVVELTSVVKQLHGPLTAILETIGSIAGVELSAVTGAFQGLGVTFQALGTSAADSGNAARAIWANAMVAVGFLANSIVQTIGMVFNGLLQTFRSIGMGIQSLVQMVAAAVQGDYSAAEDAGKQFLGGFKEWWDTQGAIANDTTASIGSAWSTMLDQMAANIYGTTPAVDKLGESAKKTADALGDLPGMNPPGKKGKTAKAKKTKVPKVKAGMGAPPTEWDEFMGGPVTVATPTAANAIQDSVNANVSAMRELLNSSTMTANQMRQVWDQYEQARMVQIEMEGDALRAQGVAEDIVAMSISAKHAALVKEEQAVFSAHGTWMRQWATTLSQDIRTELGQWVSNGLRGDWESLTDVLSNIWTSFLDKITQQTMDQFLNQIFNMIGGAVGGSGSMGTAGGTAGGFVDAPIGGYGGGAVAASYSSTVNVNVSTPNATSFNQSTAQVQSRAYGGLVQAQRRAG
jgi:TP901 family phage tail tape measure protein